VVKRTCSSEGLSLVSSLVSGGSQPSEIPALGDAKPRPSWASALSQDECIHVHTHTHTHTHTKNKYSMNTNKHLNVHGGVVCLFVCFCPGTPLSTRLASDLEICLPLCPEC
jgi:hypothetical protein